MKILLATDGSALSRRMLAYVASNSLWFRREFTYLVIHVAPRNGAEESERAQTALNEALHFLQDQIGVQAQRVLRVGKPADVIADYARQEHCNLIVMGSHGYGSLESLMLGSVTQGVLTTAHVPVLVVR